MHTFEPCGSVCVRSLVISSARKTSYASRINHEGRHNMLENDSGYFTENALGLILSLLALSISF